MADLANLDPAFRMALEAMLAASGGRITVRSGYRPMERQEQLWANAVAHHGSPEAADNWVARPASAGGNGGHHVAGIAADLHFADAAAKAWAHHHAAEFGLSFPMSHEDWHIEPVGAREGPLAKGAYTKPPPGHPHPTERTATPQELIAATFAALENPDLLAFATASPLAGTLSAPATEIGLPTGSARPAAAGGVDQFMAAITGVESGGNPNAVNARTGAYGTFQIMPENWGPWAEEAGLGANAPRTPENQQIVARYKMLQYHQQFGSWDAVAVAWFAGPGRAQRYVAGDRSVLSLSDGNINVGEYVRRVNAGMAG